MDLNSHFWISTRAFKLSTRNSQLVTRVLPYYSYKNEKYTNKKKYANEKKADEWKKVYEWKKYRKQNYTNKKHTNEKK